MIVEIVFIDSVANEFRLISEWIINQYSIPTSFRGITLPRSTTLPYKERVPNPPPRPSRIEQLIYEGVKLSALSINRRGPNYNEIRANFKDRFYFNTIITPA